MAVASLLIDLRGRFWRPAGMDAQPWASLNPILCGSSADPLRILCGSSVDPLIAGGAASAYAEAAGHQRKIRQCVGPPPPWYAATHRPCICSVAKGRKAWVAACVLSWRALAASSSLQHRSYRATAFVVDSLWFGDKGPAQCPIFTMIVAHDRLPTTSPLNHPPRAAAFQSR